MPMGRLVRSLLLLSGCPARRLRTGDVDHAVEYYGKFSDPQKESDADAWRALKTRERLAFLSNNVSQ